MIGKRRLEPDDPSPDLAIETDVTSKTTLDAYEAIAVVKYAQEPTNSKEENELIKCVRQLSDHFHKIPDFFEKSGI